MVAVLVPLVKDRVTVTVDPPLVGILYVLLPIYKYSISPIKAIYFNLNSFFDNLSLYQILHSNYTDSTQPKNHFVLYKL